MARLICAFLFTVFIAPKISGAIIHVPGDSATIQSGIDGANPGDTVLIAAGVFTGDGNRSLILSGKPIHVLGTSGIDSTVLDIQGSDFGFFLSSTLEDTNASIENMTIINARRGIFLNESSPKLAALNFALCDNAVGSSFLEGFNAHPLIIACTFSHNDTGLALTGGSSAALTNCQFDSNGIGIMVDYSSLDSRRISLNANTIGVSSYLQSSADECRIDSSAFENNVTAISGNCILMNSTIRGGAVGVALDNYWQGFMAENCLFESIADVVFRTGYTVMELRTATDLAPGFAISNSSVRGCGDIALVNSEYDDAGRILSFIGCQLIGNSGGISATGADVTMFLNYTLYAENSSPILYTPLSYGTLNIINSTVANNNSDAIALGSTTRPARIKNTIIAANSGAGIRADIDIAGDTVTYSDIYDNGGGNYIGIPDQTNINGNISADPMFVGGAPFNFHLTEQSPAINAGDPQSPLDPNGTRADMGAYYFGPGYIALLSPESAAVIAENMPRFIWSELGRDDSINIFSYRLFWSRDSNFAVTDSSSILADTTYALADSLARSQSYFWKVLARNPNDSLVVTSRTRSFYIDGYPGIPTITGPPDGPVIDSSSFLSWLAAADPDPFDSLAYGVQIDEDSIFASPEINADHIEHLVSGDTILIRLGDLPGFGNLFQGITYHWRIRSTDMVGLSSPYTDGADYFVYGDTINDSPGPPVSGFSPANREEVVSLAPLIRWDPGTDPDDLLGTLSYILQLSSDSAFTAPLLDDTTEPGITEYPMQSNLADNSLYFYRIMTIDDGGGFSPWSAIQSFWTNQADLPPEPFAVYAPPPDKRQVEYYVNFAWGQSVDYDPNAHFSFELQFSNDSLFINTVRFGNLGDTILTIPTDSLALLESALFWRVVAIDDDSLMRFGGIPAEFRLLTIIPAGDANASGNVNGLDVVFLVNFFKGYGLPPDPMLAGDANGSCIVTGEDVTFLVNYLKGTGPGPVRVVCSPTPSTTAQKAAQE